MEKKCQGLIESAEKKFLIREEEGEKKCSKNIERACTEGTRGDEYCEQFRFFTSDIDEDYDDLYEDYNDQEFR